MSLLLRSKTALISYRSPYIPRPSKTVKKLPRPPVLLRNLRCKAEPVLEFERGTAARVDYDAICVLGGGYYANGTLPPWVKHRLELTWSLFEQQSSKCSVLCIGGGTPHKPPALDGDGYVLHESTLLASYLMEKGMDPMRLLKESSSYDTVGNAYFTLTIHAIPAQWKRLAIVTNRFHMQRTRVLFTDIFGMAPDALADEFDLEFFAALDDGAISPEALLARQTREAASLLAWKRTSSRLDSLQAFHKWLHESQLQRQEILLIPLLRHTGDSILAVGDVITIESLGTEIVKV